MPSFSQSFLASLGQPRFAQGMFDVGQAIGGIGGQLAEKRRRDELSKFDTTTPEGRLGMLTAQLKETKTPEERFNLGQQIQEIQKSIAASKSFGSSSENLTQGIASAEAGNIEGLQGSIDFFRKQMADASLPNEIRVGAQQSLISLQKLVPGARENRNLKQGRDIFRLTEELKGAGPNDKLEIQSQIDRLRSNPDAVREYNNLQMANWQFKNAQKGMKSDQWIADNGPRILQLIDEGDMDGVSDLVEEAGEFSSAAQKYVNASINSKNARDKLEAAAIEEKKGPSLKVFEEQIENLPEEFQKKLQPLWNAYKKASEGWDTESETWKTGTRLAAKNIEDQLRGQINSISNNIAVADYARERRLKSETDKQIKELEINLENASVLTSQEKSQIQARVVQQYKGKDLPKNFKELVAQEERQVIQSKTRRILNELAELKGEEPSEQEPQTPLQIIEEAMSVNPGKSREEVINALIKIGDLPFDYTQKEESEDLSEREKRMQDLGLRDKRMQELGRGFAARMESLGTRQQRMQALGPREQREPSLFR
jgi:hypothetical protein